MSAAYNPLPPRLPDWQMRLERLLAQRHAAPFALGECDCVTLAADVIEAITGADLIAAERGTWPTEDAARAAMAESASMADALDARLGERIAPALAQCGDIGCTHDDVQTDTLGLPGTVVVRLGAHWMAQGTLGLVPVPPSWVAAAWRCSHG